LDCTSGRAFLTGSDILLRLPAIQRKLDAAAGHNTAGYVTGYPGSPLSGLDSLLRRERKRLSALGVEFNPAINEGLAATALWGAQNLDAGGVRSRFDGVFGLWYGKGPGVEQAADPMRTASYFGTSRLGGVLALAGDDHEARSTVTAQQSETLFMHMGMPILSPSTLQEFLTFGLAGWALSRYSKLWVGVIALNDLVDAAATIDLGCLPTVVTPDGVEPAPIQLGKGLLALEDDIRNSRIPAVGRFARANRLDWVAIDATRRRVGIVVAGKPYLDVVDGLAQLGLSDNDAAAAGVSVYKLGLVWPIEEHGALEFMRGHEEIIVVEPKHPIIEDQLNRLSNRLPASQRPLIVGKSDEQGASLVREVSGLDSHLIAAVLRKRLTRLGIQLAAPSAPSLSLRNLPLSLAGGGLVRAAGFCSGCPHSTSMRVPEGHMNLGGTGCHAMATMREMDGRQTEILHHMGGEGAMWVGMSPFAERTHMFQNVGDGTFSHSGSMGLRAAAAAGVNVTFKVLANGFIAMTGGQAIPGQLDTPAISRVALAEGAAKVVVVTEDPRRVRKLGGLPRGVKVVHRKKLLHVEAELSTVPGLTVLIYDQECAAELRRHRKRGKAVDPDKRAYINPDVCEGCGDCNAVSNCISVEPLETELGRKRRIDQSSCNKDFSCVDGYCPSFVTLYGATPRIRRVVTVESLATQPLLPEPALAGENQPTYDIVVGGIGGSGVLTIGAILGRAAFIAGRFATVLNETGMAQKNGNVQSHVRISSATEAQLSPRVAPGGADLVIGGDIVAASAAGTLELFDGDRTSAVVNREVKPTVAFADDPDLDLAGQHMIDTLQKATSGRLDVIDANELAVAALGDEIYSNVLLIGFTAQKGRLPISVKAIEEAITLNGVSVEKNLQALRLGRLLAVGDTSVEALVSGVAVPNSAELESRCGLRRSPTVDEIVADRTERLVAFQDRGYADGYRTFVDEVRAAERRIGRSDGELVKAVATYLFKLMAYKDEYEVARMYRDPAFRQRLHDQFEGDFRIKVNLAPQMFNPRDPMTGRARKFEIPLGLINPAFTVLAALRRVRGTPLDVFGKTKHRRAERQRIEEYKHQISGLLSQLGDHNYDAAVQIASIPEVIRGYDSVKDQSAQAALQLQQTYLDAFAETPK
jgi:indolepyruvate ferredoxin oxidoreductase